MAISKSSAARVALAFVQSRGGVAVAQGAPPAKEPDRPRKADCSSEAEHPNGLQTGRKVRGTRIWAVDCIGASELKGTTPAEDLSSPPPASPTEKAIIGASCSQ